MSNYLEYLREQEKREKAEQCSGSDLGCAAFALGYVIVGAFVCGLISAADDEPGIEILRMPVWPLVLVFKFGKWLAGGE